MTEYESDLQFIHFGPVLTVEPVVSVAMITYNHQAFVHQAIKSVFAQYTDWPIELVIGEDCSTDGTLDAITDICKHAPISVKIIKGLKNVGMHKNIRRVMDACVGEFMAFLEGDDYWVSPSKLARQVEILRMNPSVALSFHRVKWICESGKNTRLSGPDHNSNWPQTVPEVIGFSEIADEIFIQTGSVVCRRKLMKSLPKWVDKLLWCDWVIFLMLSDEGEINFLPDVMSAYLQHDRGATAKMDNENGNRSAIFMFGQLERLVSKKNSNKCMEMTLKHIRLLALEYEEKNKIKEAVYLLFQGFFYGIKRKFWKSDFLVWIFRIVFPNAHKNILKLR